MRILYFDCFSGISGDMSLAALVDAGADVSYIETELAKIKIEPFSLSWKRVNKRGISAMKMDVILDPNVMPQHHRHYSEIVEAIVGAGFSPRATALSLAIFEKIAIAEAKIHGIPVEKVHFHEVGAIDSIVDVIGVALAIDSLAVDRILSSPVPLGSGTVNCDHGIYPVPAPATLEMMRGLPIAQTPYKLEMTTPTGAGIISGTVDHFSASLPPMIIESIGYGAGTRDLPNQPNVLRVVIGNTEANAVDWQVQPELIQAHDHQHHEHHHHPHNDEHTHEHKHEHTHEHSHEHGHTHEHEHGHSHEHKHDHNHEHTHEHSHDDKHNHNHEHTHTPSVEKHTHPHKHDETKSVQQAPIKH
ncbi:LarC family nickel insertion protein [Paenibacillus psychroresistens]|uniref:LarC family nickel insertion protein n=1 Tax=Paenibacillus psychroresistens TaxID=1778678 RepID=A0A6B8RF21_9BACL|nr:LarC family nickel insertion protein [Paenibacillus psychroresistens]QGQ94780.1 LarC family nickel insertion protein [Paenibacillus psychroresistens]